jgi:hypothetical protein
MTITKSDVKSGLAAMLKKRRVTQDGNSKIKKVIHQQAADVQFATAKKQEVCD